MQVTSFEIIAITGITLEIIGFSLMIKLFVKTPTISQYKIWIKDKKEKSTIWERNEIKTRGEDTWAFRQMFQKKNLCHYDISNVRNFSGEGDRHILEYMAVPKAFRDYWRLRTKFASMTPVILGLLLQMAQMLD